MSFPHGDYAFPVGAAEIAGVTSRTAVKVPLDRIPDVETRIAKDR